MNYINSKNKIYKVVFSLIGFILMLSGVSYAYFVSKINNNESASTIAGEAANLELEFKEGSNQINGEGIFPGWSDTKTFTVKNKSSIDVYYNLYISDIKNELMSESISYKIESTDGGYNLEKVLLPSTDGIIKTGIYIKGNKSHTYKITTYYNNLDIDQSSEKRKTFSFKIYIKPVATKTWDFAFTGSKQTFIVPDTGNYIIKLWGAQGGNKPANPGGYGGYTEGIINLEKNETLYIYVGEAGKLGTYGIDESTTVGQGAKATFNGGGKGGNAGGGDYPYSNYSGGDNGGGATDVRLIGTNNWDDINSLKSRIMVAGGGGGMSKYISATTITSPDIGVAGGLISEKGQTITNYNGHSLSYPGGSLADQTSGNAFGTGGTGSDAGSKGYCNGHDGGGGGYYGGGGAPDSESLCFELGGGGGSSFISGHTGCVAITSAENIMPKTGCTTGTTDNSCSIHYSGKKFNETTMIDGRGYQWTNKKSTQVQMPKHEGDYYAIGTGNIGNGYARIIFIST